MGYLSLLLIFFLAPIPVDGQSAEEIGDLYKTFDWRCIGPAAMGGRTVDLDVVEKQPWIIYAAIGPSGVWKTVNNGITWEPVFHEENTVSVGDVTLSQSHPDIVWVGTGESTARNSVTIGDGVYKSTDAGKSWANMGLRNTRHISRIVINPGDPNIVYVAAMGHLWGPNEERGIYKTQDGGRNWEKILFINKNTGFADLAMDPSDSLALYAAAYEYRRFPHYFNSGGPGSGLYKTTDGGKTWNKLTKDLPQGIMGRIGIGVSRSRPNIVYALIEAEDSGIWRSEDRGETWTRTADKKTFKQVNNRPFYYSQIRVDPSDDKVIYVFSTGGFVSQDMGKTFMLYSGGTHSDHHALWIDPQNPLHLIDGNDGGIDITYDGGKTWLPIQHMALAEVYQIGFDRRSPYYVYCGLQDNGLWGGPSRTLHNSGITNEDWYPVGSGDGFYAQVDPSDHNIIYGNSQVNGMYRYDLKTGQSQNIKPMAALKDQAYRYNWNAPIHISPHNPKIVYTGGNFLFRTEDGGLTWDIVSPDLTTNDPEKQKDSGGPLSPENTGAEIHCTIITIAESPVEQGVIWCGTDDGNVQVTRDGGATWTNTVKNMPELPPHTWCSRIEASHFDAGTAYAAFDGHRSDDYTTYVYKTHDYGESWESIRGNLPFGWVHVVREDLMNKNLLFVGTEFGIFASMDKGESWFSLKNNLPTTAVRDIAIHPNENDLIIGTHGRGVWIMDDILPLQEMTPDVFQADMHFFSVRKTTQFYLRQARETFAKLAFAGKNPQYGAYLTTYFKEKPSANPHIVIEDEAGLQIFEVKLPQKKGFQRKIWNLQYIPRTKEGKQVKPGGGAMAGFLYANPGRYTCELVVDDRTVSQDIVFDPDPRVSIEDEVWAAQKEVFIEALLMSKKMGLSVTAVKKVRREVDKVKKETEKKDNLSEDVKTQLSQFESKLEKLEDEIMPTGRFLGGSRETALRGGPLSFRIMFLVSNLGGFPQTPTETARQQIRNLTELVSGFVESVNGLIREDIPELNTILESNRIKVVGAPKTIDDMVD